MQMFVAQWPYSPEDLRDDEAPVLVETFLPRGQTVADAHTPEGVEALGLPATYPFDEAGTVLVHDVCQPIGAAVAAAGLRGIRCRAARLPLGAGRELAWFPATARSRAKVGRTFAFSEWFWR